MSGPTASMTGGRRTICSTSPTVTTQSGAFTKRTGARAQIVPSERLAPNRSVIGSGPIRPIPRVKWSIRNNINLQQSAILFAMNLVANSKERFLNNFYMKSKRAISPKP